MGLVEHTVGRIRPGDAGNDEGRNRQGRAKKRPKTDGFGIHSRDVDQKFWFKIQNRVKTAKGVPTRGRSLSGCTHLPATEYPAT